VYLSVPTLLLFPPYVCPQQPQALEARLSQKTRLLVFSPHPDDETLGTGGLMQRVLRMGGSVRVVLLTSGDGYPEGVELEEQISRPTAQDYRAYGELRQEEAWQVLATLGVKEQDRIFLGFPDGGLCALLRQYRSDGGPAYRSPFTLQDRPPPTEVIVPDTEYKGEDLKRELERVLRDFRPTIVVTPHPRDQHPDHCATFFFVRDVLSNLAASTPPLRPLFLTFLVHFGQWPMSGEAGTGARLHPPPSFPTAETQWIVFPLSPAEMATKRRALLQYRSQMLVMGRYLLSFARANELFLPVQEKEEELQVIGCCGQWTDGRGLSLRFPKGKDKRKSALSKRSVRGAR
jgi:LmbE family N-acetylglucosaminyl deacetylase